MHRIALLLTLVCTVTLHAQQNTVADLLLESCTGPGAELNFSQQIFDIHDGTLRTATTPIPFADGIVVVAFVDRKPEGRPIERSYYVAYRNQYGKFQPTSNDKVLTDTSSIATVTPLHDTFLKISTDKITEYFVRHGDRGWFLTLYSFNRLGLRQYRNHIFARYGYRFKSKDLQDYFADFPWYRPLYDNVDKMITEEDKLLIKAIQAAEANAKE